MRLIDADALKEEVNKKNVVGRFNTLLLIDNAPTVERPQGEWVHTPVGDTEFITCKNCGCGCPLYSYVKKGEKEEKVQHYETDFCPNCGAYMRGKAE